MHGEHPSGIVWIGLAAWRGRTTACSDQALRDYQGTRASDNEKGLPVVRLLVRPASVSDIVRGIPPEWDTAMILYEGVEWVCPVRTAAEMIALANRTYTDHDVLFFADPHKQAVGAYLLRLSGLRARARPPRVHRFDPAIALFPNDTPPARVIH